MPWQKLEQNGIPYWLNSVTNETTWTDPGNGNSKDAVFMNSSFPPPPSSSSNSLPPPPASQPGPPLTSTSNIVHSAASFPSQKTTTTEPRLRLIPVENNVNMACPICGTGIKKRSGFSQCPQCKSTISVEEKWNSVSLILLITSLVGFILLTAHLSFTYYDDVYLSWVFFLFCAFLLLFFVFPKKSSLVTPSYIPPGSGWDRRYQSLLLLNSDGSAANLLTKLFPQLQPTPKPRLAVSPAEKQPTNRWARPVSEFSPPTYASTPGRPTTARTENSTDMPITARSLTSFDTKMHQMKFLSSDFVKSMNASKLSFGEKAAVLIFVLGCLGILAIVIYQIITNSTATTQAGNSQEFLIPVLIIVAIGAISFYGYLEAILARQRKKAKKISKKSLEDVESSSHGDESEKPDTPTIDTSKMTLKVTPFTQFAALIAHLLLEATVHIFLFFLADVSTGSSRSLFIIIGQPIGQIFATFFIIWWSKSRLPESARFQFYILTCVPIILTIVTIAVSPFMNKIIGAGWNTSTEIAILLSLDTLISLCTAIYSGEPQLYAISALSSIILHLTWSWFTLDVKILIGYLIWTWFTSISTAVVDTAVHSPGSSLYHQFTHKTELLTNGLFLFGFLDFVQNASIFATLVRLLVTPEYSFGLNQNLFSFLFWASFLPLSFRAMFKSKVLSSFTASSSYTSGWINILLVIGWFPKGIFISLLTISMSQYRIIAFPLWAATLLIWVHFASPTLQLSITNSEYYAQIVEFVPFSLRSLFNYSSISTLSSHKLNAQRLKQNQEDEEEEAAATPMRTLSTVTSTHAISIPLESPSPRPISSPGHSNYSASPTQNEDTNRSIDIISSQEIIFQFETTVIAILLISAIIPIAIILDITIPIQSGLLSPSSPYYIAFIHGLALLLAFILPFINVHRFRYNFPVLPHLPRMLYNRYLDCFDPLGNFDFPKFFGALDMNQGHHFETHTLISESSFSRKGRAGWYTYCGYPVITPPDNRLWAIASVTWFLFCYAVVLRYNPIFPFTSPIAVTGFTDVLSSVNEIIYYLFFAVIFLSFLSMVRSGYDPEEGSDPIVNSLYLLFMHVACILAVTIFAYSENYLFIFIFGFALFLSNFRISSKFRPTFLAPNLAIFIGLLYYRDNLFSIGEFWPLLTLLPQLLVILDAGIFRDFTLKRQVNTLLVSFLLHIVFSLEARGLYEYLDVTNPYILMSVMFTIPFIIIISLSSILYPIFKYENVVPEHDESVILLKATSRLVDGIKNMVGNKRSSLPGEDDDIYNTASRPSISQMEMSTPVGGFGNDNLAPGHSKSDSLSSDPFSITPRASDITSLINLEHPSDLSAPLTDPSSFSGSGSGSGSGLEMPPPPPPVLHSKKSKDDLLSSLDESIDTSLPPPPDSESLASDDQVPSTPEIPEYFNDTWISDNLMTRLKIFWVGFFILSFCEMKLWEYTPVAYLCSLSLLWLTFLMPSKLCRKQGLRSTTRLIFYILIAISIIFYQLIPFAWAVGTPVNTLFVSRGDFTSALLQTGLILALMSCLMLSVSFERQVMYYIKLCNETPNANFILFEYSIFITSLFFIASSSLLWAYVSLGLFTAFTLYSLIAHRRLWFVIFPIVGPFLYFTLTFHVDTIAIGFQYADITASIVAMAIAAFTTNSKTFFIPWFAFYYKDWFLAKERPTHESETSTSGWNADISVDTEQSRLENSYLDATAPWDTLITNSFDLSRLSDISIVRLAFAEEKYFSHFSNKELYSWANVEEDSFSAWILKMFGPRVKRTSIWEFGLNASIESRLLSFQTLSRVNFIVSCIWALIAGVWSHGLIGVLHAVIQLWVGLSSRSNRKILVSPLYLTFNVLIFTFFYPQMDSTPETISDLGFGVSPWLILCLGYFVYSIGILKSELLSILPNQYISEDIDLPPNPYSEFILTNCLGWFHSSLSPFVFFPPSVFISEDIISNYGGASPTSVFTLPKRTKQNIAASVSSLQSFRLGSLLIRYTSALFFWVLGTFVSLAAGFVVIPFVVVALFFVFTLIKPSRILFLIFWVYSILANLVIPFAFLPDTVYGESSSLIGYYMVFWCVSIAYFYYREKIPTDSNSFSEFQMDTELGFRSSHDGDTIWNVISILVGVSLFALGFLFALATYGLLGLLVSFAMLIFIISRGHLTPLSYSFSLIQTLFSLLTFFWVNSLVRVNGLFETGPNSSSQVVRDGSIEDWEIFSISALTTSVCALILYLGTRIFPNNLKFFYPVSSGQLVQHTESDLSESSSGSAKQSLFLIREQSRHSISEVERQNAADFAFFAFLFFAFCSFHSTFGYLPILAAFAFFFKMLGSAWFLQNGIVAPILLGLSFLFTLSYVPGTSTKPNEAGVPPTFEYSDSNLIFGSVSIAFGLVYLILMALYSQIVKTWPQLGWSDKKCEVHTDEDGIPEDVRVSWVLWLQHTLVNLDLDQGSIRKTFAQKDLLPGIDIKLIFEQFGVFWLLLGFLLVFAVHLARVDIFFYCFAAVGIFEFIHAILTVSKRRSLVSVLLVFLPALAQAIIYLAETGSTSAPTGVDASVAFVIAALLISVIIAAYTFFVSWEFEEEEEEEGSTDEGEGDSGYDADSDDETAVSSSATGLAPSRGQSTESLPPLPPDADDMTTPSLMIDSTHILDDDFSAPPPPEVESLNLDVDLIEPESIISARSRTKSARKPQMDDTTDSGYPAAPQNATVRLQKPPTPPPEEEQMMSMAPPPEPASLFGDDDDDDLDKTDTESDDDEDMYFDDDAKGTPTVVKSPYETSEESVPPVVEAIPETSEDAPGDAPPLLSSAGPPLLSSISAPPPMLSSNLTPKPDSDSG